MQLFHTVEAEDNVAISALDIPFRVSDLQEEDQVMLQGCSKNAQAVVNVADCFTEGLGSKRCQDLNSIDHFPPVNISSVFYYHVYTV